MERMLPCRLDTPRARALIHWRIKMRKIALAIAALAIAGFAAPSVQTANAATIVVKKDHHDRDWGRHHHKKVVIIKHRRGHGDHDHD
jgi:hypothetical protein